MATRISWAEVVWNVFTGCSKISAGCRHCYAELLSLRRGWSKKPWIAKHVEENIVFHEDRLKIPYSWKEPEMCFANSMSDMFHETIAEDQIRQVFEVMNDPKIIEAGHR